jgi:hypothetical protein
MMKESADAEEVQISARRKNCAFGVKMAQSSTSSGRFAPKQFIK